MLVRSTPDRVVRVRALAGVLVLCSWARVHSASLHPVVQMGTSKYAGGNPAMDKHPIQGGEAILLAASC